MRALAALDMLRFGAVFEAPSDARLSFSRRALWAARMLASPWALSLPLRRGLVAPSVYDPANAASAAFKPFNCRATLSRSVFNSATMFGIYVVPPRKHDITLRMHGARCFILANIRRSC